MLEIARDLEHMAVRFYPAVLVCPGVAAVLLGLFVWLGGLGFRKVLFAILGAVSGGACGFFITAQNALLVVILAVVVAVIAIMFEKIFVIILTAVLAAVLGFAVLAGPYIQNSEESSSVSRSEKQNGADFDIQQSIRAIKECIADFVTGIKQIILHIPLYKWAIITVLVVVFMVTGFYQWRLASAFCCAALGTALIFTGMILLLLYKGAVPVSRILHNQPFYLGVFVVMTTFGMTEQLLLYPGIKRKSVGKKKADNDEKEPEKTTGDWLNR